MTLLPPPTIDDARVGKTSIDPPLNILLLKPPPINVWLPT